jgi:SAM-dependent methyltransferase
VDLFARNPVKFGENGDRRTLEYYEQHADQVTDLAKKAAIDAPENSITTHFDEAFGQLGDNARIVDIGSGGGNELQILQSLFNFDVEGIEPVAKLREIAQETYPELKGRIHEGALPYHLPLHLQKNFDGALCAGTIEHIPEEQLPASIEAIKSLLKGPGSRLLVSMPYGREGYDPRTGRDKTGRLVKEYDPEKFTRYFTESGFKRVTFNKQQDPGQRQLEWHNYIFELK